MIGKIIKGYRILDKIKEGSVGTVWRAARPDDEFVAIKQISERNARNARKRRQFKREATLTSRLRHPNVIRVYEYVPNQPQAFFVMEYFESENLKYAMWHLPKRVNKREFSILRQIAQALAHTHTSGIVHRDVKPENVLVSPGGDVRLIDYSLAQTKWNRILQFRRRVEGTPLYMAPEQIRGERCDNRTDIYSFGVLAYEMLTKKPPFIGTTERKVLEKHLKEPPPSMTVHVKTTSQSLDQFVMKMLSKKPEERFQDMASVIHELHKWEQKDTVIRQRQVEPVRKNAEEPGT